MVTTTQEVEERHAAVLRAVGAGREPLPVLLTTEDRLAPECAGLTVEERLVLEPDGMLKRVWRDVESDTRRSWPERASGRGDSHARPPARQASFTPPTSR